jgi:site-specific recombinase XerD
MIQEVVFMLERDVELFIEHCELKGLSKKTIGSYEQTLRLFMQHLYKNGIERTEDVTHMMVY